MSLFKPAENTSAFLKMGLLGFAGSGKTWTASTTARDLVLHIKKLGIDYGSKPAMFLDTETGSDWVKPMFAAAGIPLHTAKTRAFADLLKAVPEAEANASVLIIDSITHFWKELCESYQKQKKRTRLEFQDWGYLKGEWGKFTDLYVNSNVHILLCGRAGFEYDYFEDDSGKKQLEKTGVKMKAEGEMGFEPSLLVLMERCQKMDGGGVEATWREATVLKDRSTLLDGKQFVNPKFTDFLPHIELLNLGGKQLGVDTTRSTQHAEDQQKKDWKPIQRKIVIDELQSLLLDAHPGQSAAEKQSKMRLLREHFGDEEMTWTKVEEVMPLIDLRVAYDSMFRALKGKPSQYSAILNPQTTATEVKDSLPDHSAAPAIVVSLFEQFLADIPNNKTNADCLRWALTVSADDRLTREELNRLNTALFAHQLELAKADAKAKEPGGNEPGKEPEKVPATVAAGAADAAPVASEGARQARPGKPHQRAPQVEDALIAG